jgi:hypothetical protein
MVAAGGILVLGLFGFMSSTGLVLAIALILIGTAVSNTQSEQEGQE